MNSVAMNWADFVDFVHDCSFKELRREQLATLLIEYNTISLPHPTLTPRFFDINSIQL